MNMFKALKAKTIKEYLKHTPDERQEIMNFLHTFIQESAPSLKPHMAFNMIGYGTFEYKNYKGQLLQWPTVGLANKLKYVSIYVCAVKDGEYLAEKYEKDLGKVDVGKSCIKIEKLEDIHLPALKKLLAEAVKHPGLEGAGAYKKKKKKK